MISRTTESFDLRLDDNYRGGGGQELRLPVRDSSGVALAVLLTGGSWIDLSVLWAAPGCPPQAFGPAVLLTTGARSAKLAADELVGASELVVRGASVSAGHSCVVFVTRELETSPASAPPQAAPREVGGLA